MFLLKNDTYFITIGIISKTIFPINQPLYLLLLVMHRQPTISSNGEVVSFLGYGFLFYILAPMCTFLQILEEGKRSSEWASKVSIPPLSHRWNRKHSWLYLLQHICLWEASPNFLPPPSIPAVFRTTRGCYTSDMGLWIRPAEYCLSELLLLEISSTALEFPGAMAGSH